MDPILTLPFSIILNKAEAKQKFNMLRCSRSKANIFNIWPLLSHFVRFTLVEGEKDEVSDDFTEK